MGLAAGGPDGTIRTTWAEDRATVGTDSSADPGAKTEGRAADARLPAPPSLLFGIGIRAINPSRQRREPTV